MTAPQSPGDAERCGCTCHEYYADHMFVSHLAGPCCDRRRPTPPVAAPGDVEALAETCREWGEDDPRRCGKPAEFILWGKLLPKEAFGPRCYDHAVKHIGHDMPSRVDQYAVYDLRAVARFAAQVAQQTREAESAVVERVEAVLDAYNQHDGDVIWECEPEDRWRFGRDLRAALRRDR